jgi:DNA-binding HxlR family transcriptional regulator
MEIERRALIMGNPVARAFAVIGDAWTQLILREAFYGTRRFTVWRESLDIPKRALTDRLQRLVAAGVFQLTTPAGKGWPEYRLSAMGLDLYGVAVMQGLWERYHARSPYQERYALNFFDRESGARIAPVLLTREFGEPMDPRRIAFEAGSGLIPIPPPTSRRRRSRGTPSGRAMIDRSVEIMGDYWTWAVLSAAFFRLRRFDEMSAVIGVATNILSDRLGRLVDDGILVRRAYRKAPIRFEYRLTEAGRALFPLIMAMHGWSERWLCDFAAPPLKLLDRETGERITPVVADRKTGAKLDARQTRWEDAAIEEPIPITKVPMKPAAAKIGGNRTANSREPFKLARPATRKEGRDHA